MNSWRRVLLERLSATSDSNLQRAMQEVKIEDNTGEIVPEGIVMALATEIAPLVQTKPEHAAALVTKAVILASAYRFAGLEPNGKRIR